MLRYLTVALLLAVAGRSRGRECAVEAWSRARCGADFVQHLPHAELHQDELGVPDAQTTGRPK